MILLQSVVITTYFGLITQPHTNTAVGPNTGIMSKSSTLKVLTPYNNTKRMAACLADEKLTPFQRKVYQSLCTVPSGSVTTYKHLAARIGCKSSQAVGQALKRNPHAPTIPCHRVVQLNGSIGGFGGETKGNKISKKIQLLRAEGVMFRPDGKVDKSCIFAFGR